MGPFSPPLTAGQVRAFEARLRELGFPEGQAPGSIDTASGEVIVGGERATVASRTVSVDSVEELRRLLGSSKPVPGEPPPDFTPERAAALREARNADELRGRLTRAELEQIDRALTEFLHGDPAAVAGTYRDLVHRLHFPMKIAVHAADNVTVRPGAPLIFATPTSANYGTVTVEAGAQIICLAEVAIVAQTFTAE